jgi:asparagine synthetase B (glutamine-hydrolysing)
MNGIFGFAIYDVDKDEYFVAIMGIIPLYWLGSTWNFYVASELKALEGYCTKIIVSSWTLYDKQRWGVCTMVQKSGQIML